MSFIDNPFAEDEEAQAEATLPPPSSPDSTLEGAEMKIQLPDKPFSDYDATAREDAYNALVVHISRLEAEQQQCIVSSQAELARHVQCNETLRLTFNSRYEEATQEGAHDRAATLRAVHQQLAPTESEEWRRTLAELGARCRRDEAEAIAWRTKVAALRDKALKARNVCAVAQGSSAASHFVEAEAVPAYGHDVNVLRALTRTLCADEPGVSGNAEKDFVCIVVERLREAIAVNETLYKTYRAHRAQVQCDDAEARSAREAAAELSRWVARARALDAGDPRPEIGVEFEWANARLQGEMERLQSALCRMGDEAAIDPAVAVVYANTAVERRCAALRAKNVQLAAEVGQRRLWLRRGAAQQEAAEEGTHTGDLTQVHCVARTTQMGDEEKAKAVAAYQAALIRRHAQLSEFAQTLILSDDTNATPVCTRGAATRDLSLTAAKAEVLEQLLPIQDNCMHILAALNATLRRQTYSAATLTQLVLRSSYRAGLAAEHNALFDQGAVTAGVMHDLKANIAAHLDELAAGNASEAQLGKHFDGLVSDGAGRMMTCVRRLQRVRDMLHTLLSLYTKGGSSDADVTVPPPARIAATPSQQHTGGLRSEVQPPESTTPSPLVTLTESHESETKEEVELAEEFYAQLGQQLKAAEEQRHTDRVKRARWLQSQRFGPLYTQLYALCKENDALREQGIVQTQLHGQSAVTAQGGESDELTVLEEEVAKERLRAQSLHDELERTMQALQDAPCLSGFK